MNTTLTLDDAGGLFLPAELLAGARLHRGAAVDVDVSADRILVRAIEPQREARIVERDGLLLLEGLPADADVVAAIKRDRDERDASVARAVLGR